MQMTRIMIRATGLAGLLLGVLVLLATQSVEATHSTFAPGDVFVSMKSGQVQWRHPDGSLNAVLTGIIPGHAEGMGFDATGILYVAHWCADPTCLTGNSVERFSSAGASLGAFGSGYNCNPTSVDFDEAGNVYVGQADCTGDILKFDAAGVPQAAFDAVPENRGSMWIDLASDGCTIHYTSQGITVKRFNVCGNAQVADFAFLSDVGNALRILPDGRVLVASNREIVLLNGSGEVVQTYNVAGEPSLWFGVDSAGDGTFWASNFGSGNVYKFDLATGTVLVSFNAGPAFEVKAVAVNRAPSVVIRRGRMTGGGSVFTNDSDAGVPSGTRVTHGFELHCDKNRKPNTLEINIHAGSGSQFHLEELTFARCTDDPTITPTPPTAPFDTYEGKGTGRYNGQPGATAEWIFTDAGEPGVNDRIKKLIIKDAGGAVVLSIPEPGHQLTFGNHQAHK
ncbi:MAG: hypothetical protein HYZ81_13455 [Nitrospinae bacterium]|nr:hypothetical protein [Nitrospinota bacterium]